MTRPIPAPELDLRYTAIRHAERGFHVFPLHPGTKVPAVKRWEDNATPDTDQISQWWRRRPADNIAVACGPSGLHVLDLDTSNHQSAPLPRRHARDGRDVLADLASRTGQPIPVPTFAVATPSGGLHLYYQAPSTPVLRNTVGRLGWRIDSRGTGGYVVAAGSVLPTGSYLILDDRTPIPLPDWLIQRVATAPAALSRTNTTVRHPEGYVAAAISHQCARIRHARTGTRHRAVLLAANSLGRLVGAELLDYTDACTALLAAAQVHVGVDEFTDAEATRTITDGLTYAARLSGRPLGTSTPDRATSIPIVAATLTSAAPSKAQRQHP
ncbi:bifunctional DNA primase/polymerase [Nocardia brasiliensis]|uniref:bifunctional DNA primase/polymerase n=1 Tax=Nocardia brasiliensis TaxID=37326 RepID=UPI00068FF042|nr:bifunctional DNA primase/polymerase [Nocardia brasiliensis]